MTVKKLGYEMGFSMVTISTAEPLEEDEKRYREWCEQGYAGELGYMTREFPRRAVPQDLLPEARSVISFAVNFFAGSRRVEPRHGYGRVARYAWGKDYHLVVRQRLEEWVQVLGEKTGLNIKTRIVVDSAPLLERAYAGKSGAGFVGKNTLVIHRKLGSFIFLAEVLTDLVLNPDILPDSVPGKDACGSCKECIQICPTEALVAPRKLDARKCISYWTIENRGEIPEEFREKIGDWIFGCDLCQEVCPYNGMNPATAWREFLPESGTGPYLSLVEVLKIQTEGEFKKQFAGTPLLRAKRSGLVRNACIVSANQKYQEALPFLQQLASEDSDPVIRNHAHWAKCQFAK